mmetsp:Transcript_27489/g.72623  ORF Transcript_27489/g.72623 Transcript_27489/m.72623 type:complete len:277 (+) Transcript_27489:164-994(+)
MSALGMERTEKADSRPDGRFATEIPETGDRLPLLWNEVLEPSRFVGVFPSEAMCQARHARFSRRAASPSVSSFASAVATVQAASFRSRLGSLQSTPSTSMTSSAAAWSGRGQRATSSLLPIVMSTPWSVGSRLRRSSSWMRALRFSSRERPASSWALFQPCDRKQASSSGAGSSATPKGEASDSGSSDPRSPRLAEDGLPTSPHSPLCRPMCWSRHVAFSRRFASNSSSSSSIFVLALFVSTRQLAVRASFVDRSALMPLTDCPSRGVSSSHRKSL